MTLMLKTIVGIIGGFIIGGGVTYLLFVGTPKSAQLPGTLIQPPDQNGMPAGTAEIVLREDFFNEVLGTIFRDMNPPNFPLGGTSQTPPAAPGGCDGRITILHDGSGVQTAVRFENNRLGAPLAFSGSYDSPFGCLQFSGWAQSNFEMRYDAATQSVLGQVNVETVNLDGVNPVFSSLLTPIVQSTLNTRVNPVRILDGRQVAINMPIAATGGNLQAKVSDVRGEVKDNSLNLYVIYQFGGVKSADAVPAAMPQP